MTERTWSQLSQLHLGGVKSPNFQKGWGEKVGLELVRGFMMRGRSGQRSDWSKGRLERIEAIGRQREESGSPGWTP